ncbi:histidine kinase [Micromonosporaceae bacterium B7E4]
MGLVRDWLLPAVLAVAQLAYWPGAGLLTGRADPEALAGLLATVCCAVALGWRRRAPVRTLGTVLLAQTLGRLAVPPDALALATLADVIAFYSVAVRRPLRTAAPAGAVLVGWAAVLSLPVYGFGPSYLAEVLVALVVYPGTLGLGRSRRRWHAARAVAAARLVEAEAARQRAASTERHRLARELHDVSAHHLTAIVVTAGAALRLADRRPELVAEAVAFSARTGRETLTALHRLVAVIRSAEQRDGRPLRVRLAELADGFRRLGQPVQVQQEWIGTEPVEPPPVLADAVYAIAREALTNTLRHAPGSTVRLRTVQDGESVRVVVRDDGAPAVSWPGAPAPGGPARAAELGSGRGVPGMRERAVALGGTLTAGPAGAGWRVCGTLPLAGPAHRPGSRAGDADQPSSDGEGDRVGRADDAGRVGGRRRWPRFGGTWAVDALVTLAVLAVAVGPMLPPEGFDGGNPARVVPLLGLVTAAHVVPLLWRRRRPWAALAGVLGSSALWPVAALVVPLPGESAGVLVTAAVAEFAAVYAVAAYARPVGYTPLAAAVTALTLTGALAVSVAMDGSLAAEPLTSTAGLAPELALLAALGFLVPAGLAGAGVLTLPLLAVWLLGDRIRRRREGVLAREADAVARVTASALEEARRERARVAAGLRAAVLHRAGLVVAAAEEGRLDAVVEQARSTLTAMRGLLDTLRADGGSERRDPQPNAGAIDRLCAGHRADGRRVEVTVAGQPRPLPADVDVSAYRVVELALAAGDAGPIGVDLRYGDDDLRIVVTGVPSAADPVIVAGLRARVTAIGGELTVDTPGGRIEVWLPAPTRQVPGLADPVGPERGAVSRAIGDEEVATSPSG